MISKAMNVLRGAGSLAALVYQHIITPLALPCKLVLPELGKRFGKGHACIDVESAIRPVAAKLLLKINILKLMGYFNAFVNKTHLSCMNVN